MTDHGAALLISVADMSDKNILITNLLLAISINLSILIRQRSVSNLFANRLIIYR